MPKASKHSWRFKARFRRHAFGWRSQPAIARLQEAVSEIKLVARIDPILGAEGAVALLERISPALENVDNAEALSYAESCRGPWASDRDIDGLCEQILVSMVARPMRPMRAMASRRTGRAPISGGSGP